MTKAKLVINVVERTTLELCASPVDPSQGMTQEKGLMEPTLSIEKIDECHDDSSMEDLNEQVQSLFYSQKFWKK